MEYLRVRNWEKFQHYKGKEAPPWIKLHRDLLSNYDFNQLPELAQGRLMRLWLLASTTKNRIPNDPAWVAKQIGAKAIDLDDLVARGWLENVYSDSRDFLETLYSDSREPLESTEQNRNTEELLQSRTDASGNVAPLNGDDALVGRLLDSLSDKDPNTERTVRKLIRQHKLVEADVAWALECATGPGVVSPAAIAVSELKKRGLAKKEAAA